MTSVVLREKHALRARLAGLHARALLRRRTLAGERDAADRGLRRVLHRELRLRRAVPVGPHELRALVLEDRAEVLPAVDRHGARVAHGLRALEEEALELVQDLPDRDADPLHAERLLLRLPVGSDGRDPALDHHGTRFEVARADLDPHGDAAALPLVVLRAGLHALAVVDLRGEPVV